MKKKYSFECRRCHRSLSQDEEHPMKPLVCRRCWNRIQDHGNMEELHPRKSK